MKTVSSRNFGSKALTLCLLIVFVTASSTGIAEASAVPVGELLIFANLSDERSVTVEGSAALAGRTVFASEVVSTSEGAEAILNLGVAGRLRLNSNSAMAVVLDEGELKGELSLGSVTLLSSAKPFVIRTASGETVTLRPGETAGAKAARAARDHRDATGKCIDDDNDGKLECSVGGIPPFAWVAIVGAVAAGLVLGLAGSGGGGNGGNASPVR